MVNKKVTKKRHKTKEKTSSRSKTHKNKNLYHVIKEKLDIRHDLPLGIRAFLTYLGILSLFYIFSGVTTKSAVIMGISFQGVTAVILNFITAGIIVGLIYGFAKKDIRYYYFSLVFFTLILFNTLLSIFTIRAGMVGTIRSLVNIVFFLTIILNVITLIFIISKKYYFLHPKPEYHVHSEDKVFMVGMVAIWILILLSSVFFINKYYQESFPQADQIIFDLQEEDVLGSMNYCENHPNPDLCNYIGAIINKDDVNSIRLCERIKLPFFYNDCMDNVNREFY